MGARRGAPQCPLSGWMLGRQSASRKGLLGETGSETFGSRSGISTLGISTSLRTSTARISGRLGLGALASWKREPCQHRTASKRGSSGHRDGEDSCNKKRLFHIYHFFNETDLKCVKHALIRTGRPSVKLHVTSFSILAPLLLHHASPQVTYHAANHARLPHAFFSADKWQVSCARLRALCFAFRVWCVRRGGDRDQCADGSIGLLCTEKLVEGYKKLADLSSLLFSSSLSHHRPVPYLTQAISAAYLSTSLLLYSAFVGESEPLEKAPRKTRGRDISQDEGRLRMLGRFCLYVIGLAPAFPVLLFSCRIVRIRGGVMG